MVLQFSQRIGKTPKAKQFQIDSIDDDLRNCLWNVVRDIFGVVESSLYISFSDTIRILWSDFFKRDLDELNGLYSEGRIAEIKEWFYSDVAWYKIYDFIEFFVSCLGELQRFSRQEYQEIIKAFNLVFEREFSAYRFVDGVLSPITNEAEIQSIEDTAQCGIAGVQEHIHTALKHLSDREHPDYRNSIKESISAVESICTLIAGEKATLGDALKKIQKQDKINLHRALQKGFSNLYGYTNDAGIRHAIMDDQAELSFADAKYMLVSCSAFVNYLIEKAQEAEIELK